MNKIPWKSCAKWVLLSEAVGFFAGWLTADGVEMYRQTAVKSPLTPPGWVFPLVWGILYALMGIGICLVSRTAQQEGNGCKNIFVGQLIVNFFWPLLFFNAQAYGFALAWLLLLLLLVVWMTVCFWKKVPAAAWLQIPYILWLIFASYLNGAAWQLN